VICIGCLHGIFSKTVLLGPKHEMSSLLKMAWLILITFNSVEALDPNNKAVILLLYSKAVDHFSEIFISGL
jgi:hypothetical protein